MRDSLLHMLPILNSVKIKLNFVPKSDLLSHSNITNDVIICKSGLYATS